MDGNQSKQGKKIERYEVVTELSTFEYQNLQIWSGWLQIVQGGFVCIYR